MKEIQLTRGMVALVDDADYDGLNKYNWIAIKGRHTFYAAMNTSMKDGPIKCILMHRLILGIHKNRSLIGDHRNRDGLDNRRENLRLATYSDNGANAIKKCSKSKYLGVSKHTVNKKWIASICKNYKTKYIGSFDTQEQAAAAYNKSAIEIHGEFARLNMIRN